jgi:hypothetical protein
LLIQLIAAAVERIDVLLDGALLKFISDASEEQWKAWVAAAVATRQAKKKSAAERANSFWHEVIITYLLWLTKQRHMSSF